MAHKNFRMLWNTRWFDAATLSAVSEASGYPVSCLQDPFRSRKYRSTSIAGGGFVVDFGAPRPFNTVALIDHNLSATGSVRVMASNSLGGSDLWDQTYEAWPPAIGFGEGMFDEWGFGGFIPEADRVWAAPNPIRIIYLEDENEIQQSIKARYLQIEPIDSHNPDGYFQLGNLLPVQYADFGFDFMSIRHGTIDNSEIEESLGGQDWVTRSGSKRRTVSLTFNVLQYLDKYWTLKFAVEKLGLTKTFLIDCFPSQDLPSQNHHSILYGKFQDLPEIEQDVDMGFHQDLWVSTAEISFKEDAA